VHIILIYLELVALRFPRCVLVTGVLIHWRFDREDFLLCTLRLPAERMLRERSSLWGCFRFLLSSVRAGGDDGW
jgi:hypothetical protein